MRFVLITSYARLHDLNEATPNEGEPLSLTQGEQLLIRANKSTYAKCVRCWHLREDVGASKKHPELCGRCVENVDGSGEPRRFT